MVKKILYVLSAYALYEYLDGAIRKTDKLANR